MRVVIREPVALAAPQKIVFTAHAAGYSGIRGVPKWSAEHRISHLRYPFGNFRFQQVLRASHGLPAAIESLFDLLASSDSLMILWVSAMATPIDAVANWDAELKKK